MSPTPTPCEVIRATRPPPPQVGDLVTFSELGYDGSPGFLTQINAGMGKVYWGPWLGESEHPLHELDVVEERSPREPPRAVPFVYREIPTHER